MLIQEEKSYTKIQLGVLGITVLSLSQFTCMNIYDCGPRVYIHVCHRIVTNKEILMNNKKQPIIFNITL